MPQFWENLTPTQRKLVLFGLPLVAVAAIVSMVRRPEPTGEDDAGPAGDPDGTGRPGGQIPGGTMEGTGDTRAIGTGALSSFLEGVSDVVGELRSETAETTALLRTEFVDEMADLRSTTDAWRTDLADQLAQLDRDRDTPTSPGPAPRPPADSGSDITYSPTEQRVVDLFNRYGVSLTATPTGTSTESAADRVARIAREIEAGDRRITDIEKSVRYIKANQ